MTVLVPEELYNRLVYVNESDEVQSLMETVRTALRLYLWYREQIGQGFSVSARKVEGDKEILRELLLK